VKVIINKVLIAADPKLAVIKKFRMTNKRAGEFKRAMNDETQPDETRMEARREFQTKCDELKDLALKAESLDFHIWVNIDGKTGHTYEKDYKVTDEATNDYEAHQAALQGILDDIDEQVGGIIFPAPGMN